MPRSVTSSRPLELWFRVVVLPAIALVMISGCASTPEGPAPEVDLAPEYHFSGMVAGRAIEGTLSFPEEGGYIISSRSELCVRTQPRQRWQLQSELRSGSLRLRCGFDLRVKLIDGDLATDALATIVEVENYQVTGNCEARDENGTCIRHELIDRTRRISHEGYVRIEPVL